MSTLTRKKLTDLRRGIAVKVVDITYEDKAMVKRFQSMGIYKGATIIRKTNGTPIVIEAAGADVALGEEFAESIIVEAPQQTIFLLGNPNVGKSTIFSRLTGIKVYSANYPGTTVTLSHGEGTFYKTPYSVYDMPGVYSLDEACTADNEACSVLKTAPYDIAIYVADAQHLERNLFFAMEIIALGKPVVLLLNKYDMAQKKGIEIDTAKLSDMLGVPVVTSNGMTGQGLKKLEVIVHKLAHNKLPACALNIPQSAEEKWQLIGKISKEAQTITHRHPSLLEKLEDATTAPLTGLPIALVIMMISFMFIRYSGEGLITLLEPLYENYYLPFAQRLFSFAQGTFAWPLLFGGAAGSVSEGFGMLSEGVKIALVDVLSYVFSFYVVLEFLGDLGYLPRMAIVLDKFLHKIGLHGYSAIPIMLGFGCKVPAVMGVRALETRRQKIIAIALILMLAPCISQTAMMFSVVGPHGLAYIFLTFGILAAQGIFAGWLLNKVMRGDTTDIFMEVPPWQMPRAGHFARKLLARIKEYLLDAVPLIILGILLISALDMFGITAFIGKLFYYPVQAMMGLPAESAPVISLGFLRKDVSIALLEPFMLSPKQLVVACIFMTSYLPCAATFFVLLKEMGIKDGLKICAFTLVLSFALACLVNLIL